MTVKSIKIKNYKNLTDIQLEINSKINCFIGLNGAGKTNFLDSIYFLSNTRSYFNHIDSRNISYDEDHFFIEGKFNRNESNEMVSAFFSADKGKIFKNNGKKYKKLSEHYGTFPVVIITPYDINLILDGSEFRRNFIDTIISLYDKEYLENLINYKKILLQRNNLLKKFAENRIFDNDMLAIFDYKLIKLNPLIFGKRKSFITEFLPIFKDYYFNISNSNENIDIQYISDLNDNNIEQLLQLNLKRDLAVEHTCSGIHKDDLNFTIDGYPLKKNASQGQQKTFLTALKFAECNFIQKITNVQPILLLDDIFDKLDSQRTANIVKLVAENHFGQIFITHTDNTVLNHILEPLGFDYSTFFVKNGDISNLQ